MAIQVKSLGRKEYKAPRAFQTDLPERLIVNSTVSIVPRNGALQASHASEIVKINRQKRVLDVVFSSVAILLLLPFLPVCAVIIKLSSKGPVFFKQKREGKGGESFICYKFRSMHISKEIKTSNGMPLVTGQMDKRIFKFGLFMRRNNIDELPQLFNVLKGEMSLAGPRPYMISECKYWKQVFDDFKYRELIKPGMSGLAQVNGYRGGSLCKEHMRTRLDYDLIYVKSYTFWVDVKVIWRTILQMMRLNTEAP